MILQQLFDYSQPEFFAEESIVGNTTYFLDAMW